MSSETAQPTGRLLVDVVRWLVELFAIVVLAIWGFTEFEFPWPAFAFGLGAPLLALLVWALFLSPRAVFGVDQFGKALVEIVIFSSAALAMLFMGWPWWSALALVVVATAAGIIAGRRASAAAEQL